VPEGRGRPREERGAWPGFGKMAKSNPNPNPNPTTKGIRDTGTTVPWQCNGSAFQRHDPGFSYHPPGWSILQKECWLEQGCYVGPDDTRVTGRGGGGGGGGWAPGQRTWVARRSGRSWAPWTRTSTKGCAGGGGAGDDGEGEGRSGYVSRWSR